MRCWFVIGVSIIFLFAAQNDLGVHADDESDKYSRFPAGNYYEFHGQLFCPSNSYGLYCSVLLLDSDVLGKDEVDNATPDKNNNGSFVLRVDPNFSDLSPTLELYIGINCCGFWYEDVTSPMLKNYTSSESSKPVVITYTVDKDQKVTAKEN